MTDIRTLVFGGPRRFHIDRIAAAFEALATNERADAKIMMTTGSTGPFSD